MVFLGMRERSSRQNLEDPDKIAFRVTPERPKKNPHAAALGRIGGLRGGKARALKLSAEERSEIARNAAIARWHSGEKPT